VGIGQKKHRCSIRLLVWPRYSQRSDYDKLLNNNGARWTADVVPTIAGWSPSIRGAALMLENPVRIIFFAPAPSPSATAVGRFFGAVEISSVDPPTLLRTNYHLPASRFFKERTA